MELLEHQDELNELLSSAEDFKVTVLLGPRRSGKTTLLRQMEVPEENCFDLENPVDQGRLENAEEVLGELRGLVVIDGFERQPELFPLMLEMATSWGGPSRFLVVGSLSPGVMRTISEVMNSKVNVIEMGGLGIRELGAEESDRLWLRGGLPESFFAESDEESAVRREAMVQAFLRRDLPGLGIDVPAERLRRFWVEAARRHGEAWNSSAVAAEVGVSHPTARAYLNLLTDSGMLRQMRPFVGEGTKRVVKAPKVYVRDSGLLHGLLGIESLEALEGSSMRELSWKGFALEQLVGVLGLKSDEMVFWATHGGAEIDLVIERGGKRYGFEFKMAEKPGVSHSMTIAKGDLVLEEVYVVYPGERSFELREGMEALGLAGIAGFELP